MQKFKIANLLLLLFLINGCGFHLRGSYDIPRAYQVLQILPNQPYDPLQRALKQTLKYSHVTIVEPAVAKELGAATLTLLNQTFNERVVAYGNDGQVNRSVLQLKIFYQLTDPNGKCVVSNGLVEVERDLTVNPNAVLGTNNEREVLQSELIQDAASRLVWQLSIAASNLPPHDLSSRVK